MNMPTNVCTPEYKVNKHTQTYYLTQTLSLSLSIYIYIYIYACVCVYVCVCVCVCDDIHLNKNTRDQVTLPKGQF